MTLFAAAALALAPAAAEPAAPATRLVVEAHGDHASEKAGKDLARELAVALVRQDDCTLRLLPPDDEGAADIEVRVVLTLYREEKVPGGTPVWDPLRRREVPGVVHRVTVAYDVAIARPGADEPLVRKDYRSTASAQTEAVRTDPVARARRELGEEIIRRVSRLVCKALDKT